MTFTILTLTVPPTYLPALLEHITAYFAFASFLNVATAHVRGKPRADDVNSLWRHVVEMAECEVIVVGVCRVVVGRTDGVCCPDVGFGEAGAREDLGEPVR